MALTFYREPIDHGDSNTWGSYLMSQVRRGAIGALTMELYYNGSVATVSPGYAGIDNGTVKGTIENSAAIAIDISTFSNYSWIQIELSIVGGVATLTATQMVDVGQYLIPATAKVAYDYTKQGYYITATKRLIGMVYRGNGASLGRIISCENNKLGFRGIEIIDKYDPLTGVYGTWSKVYIAKASIDFAWDMDGVTSIHFPYSGANILHASAWIIRDDGNLRVPIDIRIDATLTGNYQYNNVDGYILLRVAGGYFDSVDFNDAAMKRGTLLITYET